MFSFVHFFGGKQDNGSQSRRNDREKCCQQRGLIAEVKAANRHQLNIPATEAAGQNPGKGQHWQADDDDSQQLFPNAVETGDAKGNGARHEQTKHNRIGNGHGVQIDQENQEQQSRQKATVHGHKKTALPPPEAEDENRTGGNLHQRIADGNFSPAAAAAAFYYNIPQYRH